MKKNFDFNEIGKRTPYSMPNGFIEQMEDRLWLKLQEERECATTIPLNTGKTIRTRGGVIFRSLVATAAAVTLLFVCHSTTQIKHSNNFSDIEMAFDNLSYDDQQFMMDNETNDIFVLASEDQTIAEY